MFIFLIYVYPVSAVLKNFSYPKTVQSNKKGDMLFLASLR